MAKKYDPTPPWGSFEVVLRGTDDRMPCSDVLLSGVGDSPKTALQKVWNLQYHGWPDAIRFMRDKKGEPLIERPDKNEPGIWILKCKPSCWRLYFYVAETAKRIIYLCAVCKKEQKRDPRDTDIARSIYVDNLTGAGSSRIAQFSFPRE